MSTVPKLINLSSWIKSESFEDLNLPSELWMIPTPEERGITYSIFMSYLFTCEWNDFNERLLERLKILFQSDEQFAQRINVKNLKKHVKKYNPFRNSKKHMFNCDVEQQTSDIFREKLNSLLKTNENEIKRSDLQHDVLDACSKLLKCSLILFNKDEDKPKEFKINNDEFSRKLYIFYDSSKINDIASEGDIRSGTYGFGMCKEHAFYHRRYALEHILKTAEINTDTIGTIKNEIYCYDNFLHHALNNSHVSLLKKIYHFPHILKKLNEAGFNMNPLETDEKGLSAFYYSISLTDVTLLKLFYNYVSNNFYKSDSSVRRPEIMILDALKLIKKVVENDKNKSNNFCNLHSKIKIAQRICLQIVRFNEYQIETMQLLIDIEKSGKKDLAKTKDIIISIIDIYYKYFYFKDCQDPLEKLFDYILFHDYYEFLDRFFCLLFFDHFFCLSPLLNDNNKYMYTSTASSLLMAIISHNTFPLDIHNKNCENISSEFDEYELNLNIQRFVPFCYRKEFIVNAMKLKEELGKETIEMEIKNISKDIMKGIRQSLNQVPEILEEFMTDKIRRYLQAVSWSEELSRKNMIIVERTLQVLGEIMQNEQTTNCLTKHFLCSVLTDGLEHQFCKLRDHCFSKYRANAVYGRMDFESNYSSFEVIKNEFECISNSFECIITKQSYMTVINMLEKTTAQCTNSFEFINQKLTQKICNLNEQKISDSAACRSDFKLLLRNMVKYVKKTLENIIETKKLDRLEAILYLLKYLEFYDDSFKFSKYINHFEEIQHQSTFSKQDLEEISSSLDSLNEDVTNTLSYCPDIEENSSSFVSLEKLLSILKHNNNFNKKESTIIQEKINDYFVNSMNVRKYCIDFMKTESDDVLKEKLSMIIMQEKDRKYVLENKKNNCEKSIESLNTIEDLVLIIDSKKHNYATELIINMTQKAELREVLLKIRLTYKLSRKVYRTMNHKIFFLINRIDRLKEILIDDDEHIKYLWNRGKGENVRKYVKQLICRRFVDNNSVRISTEMLIFDCMNILYKHELKIFWEKSEDLFSGINLREFIAHGSPIIELTSVFLDVYDIPLTLIEIVSQLIDDRNIFFYLFKLWYRRKLNKYKDFIEDVQQGTSEKEAVLRDTIKSCSRWQKYVVLLPMER